MPDTSEHPLSGLLVNLPCVLDISSSFGALESNPADSILSDAAVSRDDELDLLLLAVDVILLLLADMEGATVETTGGNNGGLIATILLST